MDFFRNVTKIYKRFNLRNAYCIYKMPVPKKDATDAEHCAAAAATARQRRANETLKQKQARLEQQWQKQQKKWAAESTEERCIRLSHDADLQQRHRA